MAKRLTDTDIAAIEARHAAATNGYHNDRWEAGVGRRVILITQDIPSLLSEVRALREENEALRDPWRDIALEFPAVGEDVLIANGFARVVAHLDRGRWQSSDNVDHQFELAEYRKWMPIPKEADHG